MYTFRAADKLSKYPHRTRKSLIAGNMVLRAACFYGCYFWALKLQGEGALYWLVMALMMASLVGAFRWTAHAVSYARARRASEEEWERRAMHDTDSLSWMW